MLYFAITFDVERDWLDGSYSEELKFDMTKESVKKVLDLFEEKNIKGTFFITNEVARNEKNFVRDIAKRGHEIGVHTHGYCHKQISPNDRKNDLLENYGKEDQKRMIESDKNCLDEFYDCISFRGGKLNINKKTLEVLKELNLKLDSSGSNKIFMQIRKYMPFFENGILRAVPAFNPVMMGFDDIKRRVAVLKLLSSIFHVVCCGSLIHPTVLLEESKWKNFKNFIDFAIDKKISMIKLEELLNKMH